MNKLPLVLLPGMMCDARMWESQTVALSYRCSPIIVGDISQADSVEAIAQQVLDQAPSSFALAGLSMGGIVAFELWRQAPERITHLALLDTNARAELPERQALRQGQIEQAHKGALRELLIDELKPNYLAQANKRNQGLLDTVLAMGMDLGPDVFERQSIALRDRPDSSNTLATIDCPTLVLCGEEDSLCPIEYHRYMADEIPNADLVILPGSGHLSTLEQPAKVNEAMHRWLNS